MQHQAADFSRRVIAEVSRAETSEVVYLLRCVSPILALLQPRAQWFGSFEGIKLRRRPHTVGCTVELSSAADGRAAD
jgi:hypothetical protein